MSEIIERMARAAYLAYYGVTWEAEIADTFLRCAAAALAAIREPTEAMIAAGKKAEIGHSWSSRGEHTYTPEAIWETMIDAALQNTDPSPKLKQSQP